jgi:hypothetical protein
MNTKHLALFGIPLLALGLASTAFAYGGSGYGQGTGNKTNDFCSLSQEERDVQRAEHEAERVKDMAAITGIPEDAIKEAFESHTPMSELFETYDINPDEVREALQEEARDRMQEHLNQQVTNGIITREEADARLAHMEEHRNGDMRKGEHGVRDGSGDGNNYRQGHRASEE